MFISVYLHLSCLSRRTSSVGLLLGIPYAAEGIALTSLAFLAHAFAEGLRTAAILPNREGTVPESEGSYRP